MPHLRRHLVFQLGLLSARCCSVQAPGGPVVCKRGQQHTLVGVCEGVLLPSYCLPTVSAQSTCLSWALLRYVQEHA